WNEGYILSAIVSYAESACIAQIPHKEILKVLKFYLPKTASHSISSDFQSGERSTFLRGSALKSVLIKDNDPKIESFLKPKEKDQKYSYQDEQNLKEFKEMIGGLMPWYIVR